MAHVGAIPHFAPPYAKSYELQVDGKTIYPSQRAANDDDKIAKFNGSLYTGIHEFLSDLDWSPDGTRIALVERVYDWQPDNPGSDTGKELNTKYFLVVTGNVTMPLRAEIARPSGEPHIEWTDRKTLTYSTPGVGTRGRFAPSVKRTFRINQGRLTN